jgi:fatty-acyl-CoA synthase
MIGSHVIGASAPPLIDATIGDAFDTTVRRQPGSLALVVCHQNIRWTWLELQTRVDAVARGLIAHGFQPGERIGIWAPNCAEWTLMQFATAKAGLILVTINPAYRTAELEYALRKVGCAAIVAVPVYRGSDYVAMLRDVAPELATLRTGRLHAEKLPDLRQVFTLGDTLHTGCTPFAALEAGGDVTLPTGLTPDDPVNIQFTSGTTGFPKGATLSHRNILNNGYLVGHRIGLQPGERVCIPVPLYHCFGMVMGNLACITHGATMVYPGESFDPRTVLAAIEAQHCNALYGVPSMFIAILADTEFARFDLSSLRAGIMAGSPCPASVMTEVMNRMHLGGITIAYGMTETSPVSFQSGMDDPVDLRVATVGQVQPHLEAKLVDADGAIVPRGETGELCTRGYSVMTGYWGDLAATAAAIDADGWMHTGDLATLDTAGYCRIVGRIKDLVIRGGENIYPREIEEFLLTHAAVADVQVIGVPDARHGEELCAWIMLRAGHAITEADVRDHCRGRIAHFKIPRHIRFVDGFPMTITGKVQKFIMRDTMIAEMDGSA